jgi:excisionase family DNA binding protein
MAHQISNRPKSTPVNSVARRAAPDDRLLLTYAEAAKRLGIGRTTLYKQVWAGRLKPVRIGRAVRFTPAELDTYVSSLAERVR